VKVHLRLPIACAVTLAAVTAGIVSVAPAHARAASTVRVPKVTGLYLNVAETRLEARGLIPIDKGGGIFGIVIKADWQVCFQTPRAGARVHRGSKVTVFVSRPGNC
jgi:beta-lactam-binding protein with PASTA domain